jgi:hypothetical protein
VLQPKPPSTNHFNYPRILPTSFHPSFSLFSPSLGYGVGVASVANSKHQLAAPCSRFYTNYTHQMCSPTTPRIRSACRDRIRAAIDPSLGHACCLARLTGGDANASSPPPSLPAFHSHTDRVHHATKRRPFSHHAEKSGSHACSTTFQVWARCALSSCWLDCPYLPC